MSAEQLKFHELFRLPTEIVAIWNFALMRFFSSEEKLRKACQGIELPKVVQYERTQPFGFYTDLLEYIKDIQEVGLQEARKYLHDRLYAGLLTMDQEARRTLTTHPIPIHFIRKKHSPHFFWRVIGRKQDWKKELLQRVHEKPNGPEKERFLQETNLLITSFEQLLLQLEQILPSWDLLTEEKRQTFLKENLGYTEKEVEVTRLLTLLFPQLADMYGKKIHVLMSPLRVHIYTPSQYHLQGKSSFLYLKSLSYHPDVGFIGFDQGQMTGRTTEELKKILSSFTQVDVSGWTTEQLMTTVFELHSDLNTRTAEEIFQKTEEIVPLRALPIEEYVNPNNCSDEEYENYIDVLQAVFEKEIYFLFRNQEYAQSAQERNEVFSRYIAFALGLVDKLPKRKMLAKYQSILQNKKAALNPKEHISHIDTSFAQAYVNLAKIPLRLESLFECTVVGGIQMSIKNISVNNLQTVFGERIILSGDILKDLNQGIQALWINDNISLQEARAFAQVYGIDPNWIGTVLKYYPEKKYCDECKKTKHWVGQCGDHTMCLRCNAKYNLDHGLVPGMNNYGATSNPLPLKQRSIQLVPRKKTNLDGVILNAVNPRAYKREYFIESAA